MKVVFDIDGTLADCTHRLHFIQEGEDKDWESFFQACDQDIPIPIAIYLLKLFIHQPSVSVELWTGRPERVRGKTEQWLIDQLYWHELSIHRNVLNRDLILRMRRDHDHRPDHVIKLEYLDPKHPPDLIFEDRQAVVEAYRAAGLTVYQVGEGAY